jgi:hypothetical protein
MDDDRGALVLVHSPLVGPSTWLPTARALRRRGTDVCVPATTPPVRSEPPWWRAAAGDVVAAVDAELGPGRSVVLVGHSAAGPRLPAIGAALGASGHTVVAHVLVDAGMPYAGRRPADALPPDFVAHLDAMVGDDGLLPPWSQWWPPSVLEGLVPDDGLRAAIASECPPTPRGLYDEPVPVPDGWPAGVPSAYLSFTYEEDAVEAERRGWIVGRAEGHHLQPVVDPEGVADQLALLLGALGIAR